MTNRNRDRGLYNKLRGRSDGYTGRELMECKKDGTFFLVVCEEKNGVPIDHWDELEGEPEEIVSSWDNGGQPYPVETYIKTLPKSKPGIRIDDDVHAWLFDHRTTKEPTISDVIRGLIALKERSNPSA